MRKYAPSGDDSLALAIETYVANLAATSRFWPVLAILELALRTTLNAQLEKRNVERGGTLHWSIDPHNEIRRENPRAGRDLDKAREILTRTGKAVNPGAILDELPLGFWTILVSKRLKRIWPDIAAGFKGLESRDPKELSELLKFFKDIRNRIGHHHIIIFSDLEQTTKNLARLAHLIDPRLDEVLKYHQDFMMRPS